jgi:CHAT domain-containing protein
VLKAQANPLERSSSAEAGVGRFVTTLESSGSTRAPSVIEAIKAAPPRWLHFYCHGHFDAEKRWLSGLVGTEAPAATR